MGESVFYLFICLIMHMLKVCRDPSHTACLKMLYKVCLKGEKIHDWTCAALTLAQHQLQINGLAKA